MTRRRTVSPEDYEALLRDYCATYGVAPDPDGFVPFPAGERETPKHRHWVRLYKARRRLLEDGTQARLKVE